VNPIHIVGKTKAIRVNICQNIWSLFRGVGVNYFEGADVLSGLVEGLYSVCGTNRK